MRAKTVILAAELNYYFLGKTVSFTWDFPGGSNARITGELRQIHHVSGKSVLCLGSDRINAENNDAFAVLPGVCVTLEDPSPALDEDSDE